VVEGDGGGEREESAGQAGSEAVQGAGAVALEGEDVLGGPVDRLDSLADRREVQPFAGLVFAAGAHDRGVKRGEVGFELGAAEVLVADQRQELAGCSAAARDQSQADLLFVDLGEVSAIRAGCAVHRAQGVQAKPVKEAAVAGAVAVVGSVAERVGQAAGPATFDRVDSVGSRGTRATAP
jgi:hypothetical protein